MPTMPGISLIWRHESLKKMFGVLIKFGKGFPYILMNREYFKLTTGD